MNKFKKTYIEYRLKRAEECLKTAKKNFPDDLYTVINRLYYACFYCVVAALLCKGLHTKSHKGVGILFSKHFVKTRLVPIKLGKFYLQILDKRYEADYADFIDFNSEQVDEWIKQTEKFIKHMKTLIINGGEFGENE